mgnify:CR=1 FL=1
MSKKTLGGNTTAWRIGTEYLGSVHRFFNEHERAIHNRILKRGVSENTAFTKTNIKEIFKINNINYNDFSVVRKM